MTATWDVVREILMRHADDALPLTNLLPSMEVTSLYWEGHYDSLAIVELVLTLEETFEIDISDEDMAKFEVGGYVLSDLVSHIEAVVARKNESPQGPGSSPQS